MKSLRLRYPAVAVALVLGLSACTSTKSHAGVSATPSLASSLSDGASAGGSEPASTSAPEPSSPDVVEPSAVAGGTPPPTPSQLPHIDEATLQAFYTQKLAWKGCSGGYQCAQLKVPLDYTKPSGVALELAVVREQTGVKAKLGSVVLNPGGPVDRAFSTRAPLRHSSACSWVASSTSSASTRAASAKALRFVV